VTRYVRWPNLREYVWFRLYEWVRVL
jgi:hypothetical protein